MIVAESRYDFFAAILACCQMPIANRYKLQANMYLHSILSKYQKKNASKLCIKKMQIEFISRQRKFVNMQFV